MVLGSVQARVLGKIQGLGLGFRTGAVKVWLRPKVKGRVKVWLRVGLGFRVGVGEARD